MKYQPPYTIILAIVNLVAAISETIGRYAELAEQRLTPRSPTQRYRLTYKGRQWLQQTG
ncbi:MAG: hypothetical protein KBA82_05835 [Nitrosomonas sp.]|nr:hypothetical protein [Nitrosomonas sp.]MBP7112488.1 hypothetical protein [Nitrosomonas sp.]